MSEILARTIPDHQGCSSCGLCVGGCGQISSFHDRVAITGGCQRENGYCVSLCPWTNDESVIPRSLPLQSINAKGNYSGSRKSPQNSGLVTSILSSLVREEGAVIVAVKKGKDIFSSEPYVIRKEEDLEAMSSTIPFQVPSLKLVHGLVADSAITRIHVVGRPCQIAALYWLSKASTAFEKKMGLKIGLVCNGALDRAKVLKWFSVNKHHQPLTRVSKNTEGWVFHDDSAGSVPLPGSNTDTFTHAACLNCHDHENVSSDISVGTGENGGSTVHIRSRLGEKVIRRCLDDQLIQVNP